MGTVCSLYFIGVLTLMFIFWKCLHWLYKFYNLYFTSAAVDFKSFGKWALVTGSTDGIGKGIAYELAKRGINIVLVSRNPDKLKKVANEIESRFDVETKCVTFDFSRPDNVVKTGDPVSSFYDAISDAIEELDIGILVNNVGIGAFGEFLNAFSESENKDVSSGLIRLTYCNTLAIAKMIEIILPQMLKRKRGLIMNLSSLATVTAMPFCGIYCGSKRYDDVISKALNQEYKNEGIIVQSIRPGMVKTNMTSRKGRKGTSFFPDFETYTAHLMNTIGKSDSTAGYRFHGIFELFLSSVPEVIFAKLLANLCRKKQNRTK